MVISVLQVIRQASSHENWQSQTHFTCPLSVLCQVIVKLSLSMLILKSLIFLSAEQVAKQRLLGDIFTLRMYQSCTLMDFRFFLVMCQPQRLMKPSLSPKAIRYKVSLIVSVRMLKSDSIVVLCQLSLQRSHLVTNPPSSPNTIDPQLGCKAAQLIGLLFLCYFTIPFDFKSQILSPPSSQAVQMILSSLLKHPTAFTLPLSPTSKERMGLAGFEMSKILTELFMPMMILSLRQVISKQMGAESNFMIYQGLHLLLEGSQNRTVLSQDPLASFRLMTAYNFSGL